MPDGKSVRKPPVSAVLRHHPQGVRGTCGWCGLPCLDKTEVRGWLKYFHNACSVEMGIIQNPTEARAAVLERDHGICVDCGEDWSDRYLFRDGGAVIISHGFWGPGSIAKRDSYLQERELGFWTYHDLIWISLWQVDHKIPLWKVRHMPDLQRIEYFKLANLITRCHRCHERKTTREAADRAKFKRATTQAIDKPKRKWPTGKKIPARPWPKAR